MARRNDIRAGRAFVSLYVKKTAFVKGLDAASKRLTGFGKNAQALGAAVGGAGAVITTSLGAAVKAFANAGDALDKMSARTGVSASALAELGFAAEQSGTDLQTIEKGLFGLSRALFDAERGSAEAVDSLAEMGKTVEDFASLNPEQQFQLVADGLASIEDASRRGAVAQKLLGRAGRQLLPMLENMRALREEARDLALVPSEDAVKDAAEVTDAFNRVRRTIGAAFFEVGAAVAEPVLDALGAITRITAGISKWVRKNQEVIRTVGKIGLVLVVAGGAISAIGTAFVVAGAVIGGISTTITAVAGAFGLLFTTLAPVLAPLVAVGAAVVGLTIGFRAFGDVAFRAIGRVGEAFRPVLQTVQDTIAGVVNALKAGDVELAGRIAIIGLRLAFMEGLDAINSLVGGTFGKLVASIGGKLAEGNIAGAWQDVVAGMSTVWDGFVSGVVGTFSAAALAVVDAWKNAVNSITDFLLENAAKGGVFGRAALAGTGIDLQTEQGKAELLRQQEIRAKEKLLASARAEAAAGDADAQRFAEELEQQLIELGATPANVLADAKQAADETLTGTADAVKAAIAKAESAVQDKAKSSGDAFKEQIGSGASEAEKKVVALREELAALNKEAAERAKAAKSASPADPGDLADALGAGQQRRVGAATASFSAAALIASSQGGQSRMERLTERHIRKTDELKDEINRFSVTLLTGFATP